MAMRLLIADDSPLARSAIAGMIAPDPNFTLIGEAQDGYEALQLVRDQEPEIVLMDLNMPRCDGLLATRLIKRRFPQVIVVILTVSDDAADLFEAIRSGAQGYLLKSLEPRDWLNYLRGFAQGHWTMPREMAGRILAELTSPQTQAVAPAAKVTKRETEILCLVAKAMTNREIADTLLISEQTVKNHLKKILQKLNLKNRVDLAMHARRAGLDTEDPR